MVQLCEHQGLLAESFASSLFGQHASGKDFEGHVSLQVLITSAIDDTHSSSANLLDETVVPQGLPDAEERARHAGMLGPAGMEVNATGVCWLSAGHRPPTTIRLICVKELRPLGRMANPKEKAVTGDHAGLHMKLNHLNLTVSDVPETHRFLEKYFGLKSYGGTEPREAMSFLSDDNGMVLALFRTAKGAEVKYPAGFHVGFIQESEDRVNEINQRLREDGYEVPRPARLHGSWTFYFHAPGGFMVEVLH